MSATPFRSCSPSIITAGIVLLLFGLSGCGGASETTLLPGRILAQGQVFLDGQPLDTGLITFIPQETTSAEDQEGWIMANIKEGQFQIQAQPARYAVRIQKYQYEGKSNGKPLLGKKYDQESTLTAQFSQAGPNELRFDLSSSPQD